MNTGSEIQELTKFNSQTLSGKKKYNMHRSKANKAKVWNLKNKKIGDKRNRYEKKVDVNFLNFELKTIISHRAQ